ncbi:MAG: serine hydrolase [Saprospiraceae bacterium]|nr:serine hydrolase [Saprospiraceae bacterium]
MKRVALPLLMIVMWCTAAPGQQFGPQTAEQLSNSPAGSRILAFVDMVNHDEAPSSSWLSTTFTPRLVDKLGETKLRDLFDEIRQTDGGLILHEMVRKGMFAYEGIARGQRSGQWVRLTFSFENQSPYRLDAVGLEPGAPSEAPALYPSDGPAAARPTQLPEIVPNDAKPQSRFLAGRIDEIRTAVDNYVQQYLDLDIFSGVVLLADRGKIFYHKAFGLADREQGIGNTTNTLFNIGSMNKDFTSIVIGQLIAEGRLAGDSRLVDILPGFNQDGVEAVTIDHLLAHTSGFGDYFSMEFMDKRDQMNDPEVLLDYIRTLPLQFSPGQRQRYSNAGYVILGGVIAALTGKSYADNVRERILQPLGLQSTHFAGIKSLPHRSVGYMKSTTGDVFDNRRWYHDPNPAGAAWSTAEDILHFYQSFFYGETLLSNKDKARLPLFRMIAPYYDDDRAAIPLAGGSNGLNTVICEMLGERISIIVFANMDEPVAEHVGLGILDIVRQEQPEKPSLPAHMNVYRAYRDHGVAHVKSHFDELTVNFHPSDPKDLIINRIGYDLMEQGLYREAIELLTLNTELFPEVANCYDSLGEAYYRAGDHEQARANYKRALALQPGLPSAVEMLEKLNK